jgi:hypothetical protein
MDHTKNTVSNSSSIVACVLIAAGKRLPSRYLATATSSGSIVPAFRRHVTLLPP